MQEHAKLALKTLRDLGLSYDDIATELSTTRPTLMTWLKDPSGMPLKSYELLVAYFTERKGNIQKVLEAAPPNLIPIEEGKTDARTMEH